MTTTVKTLQQIWHVWLATITSLHTYVYMYLHSLNVDCSSSLCWVGYVRDAENHAPPLAEVIGHLNHRCHGQCVTTDHKQENGASLLCLSLDRNHTDVPVRELGVKVRHTMLPEVSRREESSNIIVEISYTIK